MALLKYNICFMAMLFPALVFAISIDHDRNYKEHGRIGVVLNLNANIELQRHDIQIEQLKRGDFQCRVEEGNVSISRQSGGKLWLNFAPCLPKIMENQTGGVPVLYSFRFKLKIGDKWTPLDFKDADMCIVYPEYCDRSTSGLQENTTPVVATSSSSAPNKNASNGSINVISISPTCKALSVLINYELDEIKQRGKPFGKVEFRTISASRRKTMPSNDPNFKWEILFSPNLNDQYDKLDFIFIDKSGAEHKYHCNDNILQKGDVWGACLESLKMYERPVTQSEQNVQSSSNHSLYVIIGLCVILLIIVLAFTYAKSRSKRQSVKLTDKAANSDVEIKSSEITFLNEDKTEKVQWKEPSLKTISSLVDDNYLLLANLTSFYPDSAVANVYIDKQAAYDIFVLVRESVKSRPAPEVGGFLMGREFESQNGSTYDLMIDAFLPDLNPNLQNNVNIQFSDQLSIDELDYVNAHHKSKKVGWIHTHPGHGIFLSPTDINSHFRAFPQLFQIAMVVESYDDYKVGIFSYKRSGKELNNVLSDSNLEFKSLKEYL
jgi:proteasome lid subunit RPN8/RPN11